MLIFQEKLRLVAFDLISIDLKTFKRERGIFSVLKNICSCFMKNCLYLSLFKLFLKGGVRGGGE